LDGGTYDLAGNQLSRYAGSFTYDAEGRLKTSTINTATTTFEYDGEGRRVKKGNETYVYDAFGNLAAEYGGTVSTAGTQYLTTDHLGSTRLITNTANGAEPRCIDYFPFGEEIPRPSVACYTPTTEPRQKFTGKERDTETGLDYFGARYMSAAQGRFTTPDWSETPQPVPYADFADPQTLNLYSYVRNNPLIGKDDDGHAWHIVGGAAAGGIVGGGLEAFRQYKSGQWNPKAIGTKALQGSFVGAAAAASAGANIFIAGGAVGTANVAGGMIDRAANAPEGTSDSYAVLIDAAAGLAGGMAGGAVGGYLRGQSSAASTSLQVQAAQAERQIMTGIISGDAAQIAAGQAARSTTQVEATVIGATAAVVPGVVRGAAKAAISNLDHPKPQPPQRRRDDEH
jgi:RHS repeat-associated protein